MLLSGARLLCRDGAVQATPQAYPDIKVDYAIQYAGNDWNEHAPENETQGTVALNSTSYAFAMAFGDFYPQRLIRAEIGTFQELEHVSYATLASKLAGAATGTVGTTDCAPTQIAFYTTAAGTAGIPDQVLLDARPGTTYPVLTLTYRQAFTSWTAGDAAAGTIPLNIPDRHAYAVYHDGASAALQLNDPDARFGSVAWERYEKYRGYVAGMAGIDKGNNIANPNDYL